jgi:hypothetical protein
MSDVPAAEADRRWRNEKWRTAGKSRLDWYHLRAVAIRNLAEHLDDGSQSAGAAAL